ncbi:hypothetical protein KY311_03860 [Candidatus Woesearchaeota archaeon]|nr:hypothetical protein [Candidatus Woesearchaeota archaeon]
MKTPKKETVLSALVGAVSTSLGMVGSSGVCCTASLLTYGLGAVGVSTLFLSKFNQVFLLAGIGLLTLSVVLHFNHPKVCVKKRK